MDLPLEIDQVANQIPEVPRDPFLSVLDHINSDQFDGIVESLDLLTNANAEQLGLALLRKQDEIRKLTIQIHGLSRESWIVYPALFRYFETSAPSEEVTFWGLYRTIIDPTTRERSVQSPVTTHELLDTLLTKMVEQNRGLPDIFLSDLSLSKRTSLACLKNFPDISFRNCDIIDDSNDRSSVRMGLSREFNADQQNSISFRDNTTPRLMNATESIVSNKCNGILNLTFEFSGQIQMERLDAAIGLVKKCTGRKHQCQRYVSASFANLNTDGTLVVKTMYNLASHALVLPIMISFYWSENYDLPTLQNQAQSVVEAASQCRFYAVNFIVLGDGPTRSIFNAQQYREEKEISVLNAMIPSLVDDKPEGFWISNLPMLEWLLHPNRLMHPRFQDEYYRFLRKNLVILSWIMERCRAPPAVLLSGRDQDDAMSHENNAPSGQTRRRARSVSDPSSSAESSSNHPKKRKS